MFDINGEIGIKRKVESSALLFSSINFPSYLTKNRCRAEEISPICCGQTEWSMG
jgi:hypothetical protein